MHVTAYLRFALRGLSFLLLYSLPCSEYQSYRFYYSSTAVMAEPTAVAKPKPKHPKYSEMVEEAISSLNEKSGTSRQAILKYIQGNYPVGEKAKNQVKVALVKGVTNGRLVQTKGTGASGSFKISKELKKEQKKAEKKRLKKEKKALKEAAKENISPDSDNEGVEGKTKAKKTKKTVLKGEDEKKKKTNSTKKSSDSKEKKSSKDSAAKKKKSKAKKSEEKQADSDTEVTAEKKVKKSLAKAKTTKKSSPGKKAKSAKSKDSTKAPKPKKTAEAKPKKKKALAGKN